MEKGEQLPTVYYHSPIGIVEMKGTKAGVHSLYFVEQEEPVDLPIPAPLQACADQIAEYFAGDRTDFSLKLAPKGTNFQQKVWAELANIPYGTTTTYMHLAKQLGDTGAIRAVGTANGRNPISIILPCHRVIGSDGKLRGYAGGLHRKQWLLEFEARGRQPKLF